MADQDQNLKKPDLTGSPWDEPLDVVESDNGRQVIGSLEDDESEVSETDNGKQPQNFAIPEGIDEEKVGAKIEAQKIVKATPSPPNGEETADKIPMAQDASMQSISPKVDPAGNPLSEQKKPMVDNISDKSNRSQTPSLAQPKEEAQILNKGQEVSDLFNQADDQGEQVTKISGEQSADKTRDEKFNKVLGDNLPKDNLKRQNSKRISNLFGLFSKKAKIKPQQPVADNLQKGNNNPAKSLALIKLSFLHKPGFIGIFSVILIMIAVIYLTENGLLSVGFERIYGIFGVEKIWGGLSRNPETALAQAFINNRQNLNFQAQGKVTLTIDETIESPITSPLVAVSDFIYLAKDMQLSSRTKALLAQYDDYYYDDDYYDYEDEEIIDTDDQDDDDLSESDDESDLAEDESGESTEDEENNTSIYDTTSQEDYESYSASTSTIKEISANFDALSNDQAVKTDFEINKIAGNDSRVSIITNQNDLYLNTSSDIKFHELAEQNKWLNYPIKTVESANAISDFYSIKVDQGFSIIGRRTKNEKIKDIRCYKYQIDSMQIGSSLSSIGIESEMVQKITGNIWIGVKDKLIHKIEMTIIPSISASVSRIDFEAEFYNYGLSNDILIPALGDKIVVGKEESTASPEISDDQAKPEGLKVERDDQRKEDLSKIKQALLDFYNDNKYFPVSVNWSNINSESSIAAGKIVPEYISDIPKDPKSAEDYYYGYRSDGKSFILSARFENLSDPQISKIADDTWLHYVYSNK